MPRIDRFLVSSDWDELYSSAVQQLLPRPVSDHFPILLYCGGIKRGKGPFKFENMWLETEGFVERVRRWWNSYNFQGCTSYVLARRLKALKEDLKTWNCQEFGNLWINKKKAMADLLELGRKKASEGLDQGDRLRREELSNLGKLEEISCR